MPDRVSHSLRARSRVTPISGMPRWINAVADLAVAVVVPHDDGERHVEFGGGHQLLEREHQAAVAGQADYVAVGFRQLGADGGGEGEA
jgi:hypothetical protein